MKKSSITIIVAIVGVLAIIGIIAATKSDKSPHTMTNMNQPNNTAVKENGNSEVDLTNQTEVTMDIKEFAFTKPNIKIKKNTKVTWTNQDSVKHNAISDSASGPKGQLLAKGESYSFTYETVGINNYYCQPHPYMKGIVNVIE